MKRSTKDLIWNRWGWAGAVIGMIISYLALQGGESTAGFIMSYLTLPFNNSTISVWIIGSLAGFILGLILQKLWRKIR